MSSRVLDLTWLLALLLGVWCYVQVGTEDVGMSSLEVNCTATIQKGNTSLCLWLVKDLKTWSEADADCGKHGGYLVAVTSPEISQVVTEIMKNNSISSLWLGVEEVVSTWKWMSDQKEVFHQGCFKEDLDDEEMDDLRFKINNSYTACNTKCKDAGKKYSKLQSPTLCVCGDTFGRHGYGDCNLLCENRTMVCGGDRDGVSSYVNVPGGAYSDWELGQPNNHQLYQTCAVMDDFNRYQWNDIKCTELSGVICELSISEEECKANDFQYNVTWGCYHVSNHSMSFYEGLYYCDVRGGRLLELEGPQKREFYVNDVLLMDNYEPRAFFIGLARAQWWWKTGEKLVFSTWGSGWPNGKDQNCAITNEKGKWNDVTCSAPYSFICQKGSTLRTTPPPTTTPPTTTTTTPTTTTPTTTEKPCDAACHNKYRLYKEQKEEERRLTYFILIGGGAVLAVILITCCIGTVFCLKSHAKKKREKKFDYFYGVDVSRPEDEKEFKSAKDEAGSQNGTKTRMASSKTPDLVPVSDGAVVMSEVAPPSEKTALDDSPEGTLGKNGGIDNSGYNSTDRSSSAPLVADSAPLATDSSTNVSVTATVNEPETETVKPDVETPSTSDVSPEASEMPSNNPDDVSDASTARFDEADDNLVILPTGEDMTSYDYDKPDSSQMIY